MTDARRQTAVLAILRSEADQALLRAVLDGMKWNLLLARTLPEAQACLHRRTAAVVVTECCFPGGGSWTNLMDDSAALARPPRLIVVSRLADARLWGEVLNLGGQDVLALPFDRKELAHSLQSAWRSWKASGG
jgi:DNA-binding NtrC family response regulator